MTVYYYDLFTGTAGTLLTSHTADSGATWPNDADHYYGTGIVTLDGLGGVYQSNTGSSINLTSAAMPSTQHCEVLFTHVQHNSLAGGDNAGLVLLSTSFPTIASAYGIFYADNIGWELYQFSLSEATLLAGPYAGPAFGVTCYMKVDVSTSGGNTTFTVYYATAGTGPFTQLFSYTAATSTDLVAVGTWFYNPSTASTATTGQHIGALTVQDIPALSSATLSGPTQQLFSNPAEFTVVLNEPAGTGGIVVTLSSSNGSDTFQATQGGANVTSITLAAGQPSGTFWLTPGGATGNRTITITTSPALTYLGCPLTYDALPATTSYTVTGATGGHQLVAAAWTIALTGGDFSGTITATPNGGQLFSPYTTTFTGNGTLSKTFSFTPVDPDMITFTFTNSGSLTNPATKTYVSTGIYYEDTFSGSSGTNISAHTSNTLPSGLAGSGYTVTGSGAIELDGNGLTFLSSTGDTYAITEATMPAWSSTLDFEVLFDIENVSTVSGSIGGIMLVTYSGGLYHISFSPSGGIIQFYLNGTTFAVYTTTVPAAGTLWHMKFDWIGNGVYPNSYLWYSTDNVTWNALWSGGPELAQGISPVVAVGPYMQGTAVTATTGVHVGNIVVQDVAPPPPNCSIATSSPTGTSGAYISTCGQKAVFFFATGLSGGAATLTPTAMNFAPSFFRNGTAIGIGINGWVTGQHSCAAVDLQPGVQINPGDVVTVSTPASWMTCGIGNAANAVANFALANYSGMSCFGSNTLVKKFKPGLNFSDLGTTDGTRYNIPMNWRYRMIPSEPGSQNTVDGYPTVMYHQTETLSFLNLNSGNDIDNTNYPGVPGYWAIGFDDNYVAENGSPTTLTIVSQDTTKAIVTQITANNNPGSGGLGQYYLFDVQPASGSTSANLPIALQWYNPAYTPYISNLWIVGPGDFTVPTSGNTTWSFPITGNPYALSGQFLERLASGAGSMRFADSWLNYGSESGVTEPWELRNLTDFSWNNSFYNNYTIGYESARALNFTNSPYVYSEWIGTPYSLTLNTGVNATTTSFSINAGSDAWAVPITGLLLTMGTGEKCRIRSVSGTTNPYTCTVERGSSGTVAASQSAGTITCASRLAVTELSQVGDQLVEIVTQSNHNLRTGLIVGFGGNGTYPTMTFTDGSTNNLGGTAWVLAVTSPTTFVVDMRSATSPPATLTSTYTLSPSLYLTNWSQPGAGFPIDFCAIMAGTFAGCNLHVNIPPIASDSLCYAVAARVLANFPAGRKVYVELADEWWNWGQSEIYQGQMLDRLSGYSSSNSGWEWYVIRTGQIRNIFRTAFGSRDSEINAIINFSGSDIETMASIAISNGVTVDAFAVAPYVDPTNIAANITSWNNSVTIQQMIDLWIHDLYYNTQGWQSWLAVIKAGLATYNANPISPNYNATTGGTCFLYGYEGGFETGAPGGANNLTTLSHDLPYDPNWLIIEQDFYALLQTSGFVNLNLYSYDIYYNGSDNWGLYHSPYQPCGKGDGSDGKANNRLCLATPGYEYTKASTTNQDEQNVSVRGQAFLEWMQPAQVKKRMLFVPYRFVNR
jgi:hypothetical protein